MAQRKSERKDMDITLQKIDLSGLGKKSDEATSHLFGLEVIWPRMSIARRSGVQGCRLVKGCGDFELENWGKRILIREPVEGHFAVRVTLSEEMMDENLRKFLRFFGSVFMGVAADAVDDMLPIAGKLAAAPFDYASKEIAKTPGPEIDAEGMAELLTSELPESGGSTLLTVQMFSARKFVKTRRRKIGRTTKIDRKLILDKGVPVGTATLQIHIL